MKTHYFYAVQLPIGVKETIHEYCNELKSSMDFKRWTHYKDYHITLAFLGYAPENQLKLSVEKIRKALAFEKSFSLTIDRFGYFGRKDSPRIFWAGVQEEPRLFSVRDIVFNECIDANFELDKRPFHPHITVAKNWMGEEKFSLKNDPFQGNPLTFIADKVVLYQTHLDKNPKYEEIEVFQLR